MKHSQNFHNSSFLLVYRNMHAYLFCSETLTDLFQQVKNTEPSGVSSASATQVPTNEDPNSEMQLESQPSNGAKPAGQ